MILLFILLLIVFKYLLIIYLPYNFKYFSYICFKFPYSFIPLILFTLCHMFLYFIVFYLQILYSQTYLYLPVSFVFYLVFFVLSHHLLLYFFIHFLNNSNLPIFLYYFMFPWLFMNLHSLFYFTHIWTFCTYPHFILQLSSFYPSQNFSYFPIHSVYLPLIFFCSFKCFFTVHNLSMSPHILFNTFPYIYAFSYFFNTLS